MKMMYDGNKLIARLDEGGNKLIWDDGDTWCRAGLNGTWEEVTGVTNVIDGSSMTTTEQPVEASNGSPDLASIEAALRAGYRSSVASDEQSRVRHSISIIDQSLAVIASASPKPRAIM